MRPIRRSRIGCQLHCLEERTVPASLAHSATPIDVNPYARVQSVTINGGEEQRSMVTLIRVEFDRPVEFSSEPYRAFELTNASNGEPVDLQVETRERTALLTFPNGEAGSLADGRYHLRVIAEQVDNGKLDGNGDGEPGDDYLLESSPKDETPTGIYRLFGDVTGDGHVDLVDFIRMRQALGPTFEADESDLTAFDANGDGQVELEDVQAFRERLGRTV